MKKLLLGLLVGMVGVPGLSWAATGDSCLGDLPSDLNKSGIHCKVLCDYPGTDTSCATIEVPLTKTACHTFVYVSTLTGTTPTYDRWLVVSRATDAAPTGEIPHIMGVLDDDGTVGAGECPAGATNCGVTMLDIYGPVLPYMTLVAGSTSGTDPDFKVHLLQYECPNIGN